ncbi:MAG: ribose-phosphate pyrophosphokinase [Bdellovibrionales bacterium]|nr:ribose-phosphate pyrophosphokinase [Bdellovibrionales bacterium]
MSDSNHRSSVHLSARPFKVFAGSSNPSLAEEIVTLLGSKLGERKLSTFSDGEIQCEIRENVRGLDTYVVQSTCNPANTHLMELLILGDALRRASVRSACAVIPYYGYSRQDRKTAPRTPITAKLIADLITAAGFNRVIAVDLHAGQIQGFFHFPVDHLFGSPVMVPYLKQQYSNKEVTIVSPDAGGTERARIMAKFMGAPLAIVDKRRSGPNEAKAMNLIGEVRGRVAIIVDDMVDTAGTLTEAVRLLRNEGAAEVVACMSHGIFSGPALTRLKDAQLNEIIVTNTIPLSEGIKNLSNLRVLTVAPMVAETIRRIQCNASVSAILEGDVL